MRVFIAHSKSDAPVAEAIAVKLRTRGADVFFDEHSLPPGQAYDERIRDAIQRADVFVFVLSPASVTAGTYALTELGIAKRCWPNPDGRVLAVMVADVDLKTVDPYLTAAGTILRPRGDTAAEAAEAAFELGRTRRGWRRTAIAAGVAAAVATVGVITWQVWLRGGGDGGGTDDGFEPRLEAGTIAVEPDPIDADLAAAIDAVRRGLADSVFQVGCACTVDGKPGSAFCGAFLVDGDRRIAVTDAMCGVCPIDRVSPCTYTVYDTKLRGCSVTPSREVQVDGLAVLELRCDETPPPVTFTSPEPFIGSKVDVFGIDGNGNWRRAQVILEGGGEGHLALTGGDLADFVRGGPILDPYDRVIGVLDGPVRGGSLAGRDARLIRNSLRDAGIAVLWAE